MSANEGPRKGDMLEIVIDKLVTGGDGLGRLDEGPAVFVPGTIPGERVRARVVQSRKGFLRAELDEVLDPSPDRVDPPLGEVGALSGCDLQHMSIEAQRRAKADIVRDCFVRLGKLDPGERLDGPVPAGPPLGYRNKLRLWRSPTGRYGVRRRGSHDVLEIERHDLMPDLFNDEILPFLATLPPADEVVVRLDGQGNFLVSLFGPPARLRTLKAALKDLPDNAPPHPACTGLLYDNRPIRGRDHLLMKLAGHTYRVQAGAFFQVNAAEAEAAVLTAGEWLDAAGVDGGTLVDLYCGAGLFALALGGRFERVVGVENDERAVRDARNNLSRGGVEARVIRADAAAVLGRWREGDWREGDDRFAAPDWQTATVVVDPPRSGLGEGAVTHLIEHAPARLLYMSCDPATLARDCGALTRGGYDLTRVRVIDMFPQTGHVEALAELVRT